MAPVRWARDARQRERQRSGGAGLWRLDRRSAGRQPGGEHGGVQERRVYRRERRPAARDRDDQQLWRGQRGRIVYGARRRHAGGHCGEPLRRCEPVVQTGRGQRAVGAVGPDRGPGADPARRGRAIDAQCRHVQAL